MALRKKILIVMVSLILTISLTLCLVCLEITGSVVSDFEDEIITLTAQKLADQMQNEFSNVKNMLTRMVEDTQVYDAAEAEIESSAERQFYGADLKEEIEHFLEIADHAGNKQLAFVNVYLSNGVTVTTAGNEELPYGDFDAICDYLDREDILSRDEYRRIVWYDVVQLKAETGRNMKCYLCVRFLLDRVTMERIGVIVAGVETDRLWQIYKTVFPKAMIVTTRDYVVEGGTTLQGVLKSPKSIAMALPGTSDRPQDISYTLNDETQRAKAWTIAEGYAFFLVPQNNNLLQKSNKMWGFLVNMSIVTVVAVIIACIAALFFSKTLTNGLKKLEKTVHCVASGERNVRFIPKKRDEVAYVGLRFNHMLDQLEKYYTDIQNYEKEKKELEMSLLQARINPHLLYNTLDIVVWAIRNNEKERAETLVYKLSNFFKQALAKGKEFTSLYDEVELTRTYLAIQNLAGNKAYQLQTNIDLQLEDYEIPHLLIQPIIENCVVHGFRAFRDDGTIQIIAEKDADSILLHIRDDGMGLAPNHVQQLNRLLHEELYSDCYKHYGLRNIGRRIQILYGMQYGLEVSSEMGEYTDVVIRLPYQKNNDVSDVQCLN